MSSITEVDLEEAGIVRLLARLVVAVHVAVAVGAQRRAVHRHRVPAHNIRVRGALPTLHCTGAQVGAKWQAWGSGAPSGLAQEHLLQGHGVVGGVAREQQLVAEGERLAARRAQLARAARHRLPPLLRAHVAELRPTCANNTLSSHSIASLCLSYESSTSKALRSTYLMSQHGIVLLYMIWTLLLVYHQEGRKEAH